MTVSMLLGGLIFLILGAECLVRGASRLAGFFGISPLVIGLTVVAFGTSSPELAVSVKSALSGQAGLALGNVVGSNIFNILFILGLSALIVPLSVSRQLIRLDVPLMIVLSVLVLFLSLDGRIDRANGGFLVVCLTLYIGFLIYAGRSSGAEAAGTDGSGASILEKKSAGLWIQNLGLAVGGLVLLVVGSRWLVGSAVVFATRWGVSELVIGLTIVAAGTSLPEVVTSILAAVKGERDIAIGNVVGSNIFNILGVLGITGLVTPSPIEVSAAALHFDIPVMIGVSLACMPIFFSGGHISRWEGGLLLGYEAAYTLYLVLAASHHDALPGFSAAMLFFVLPLTVITLAVVTLAEMRRRKNRP